jgi:hypothetical protein
MVAAGVSGDDAIKFAERLAPALTVYSVTCQPHPRICKEGRSHDLMQSTGKLRQVVLSYLKMKRSTAHIGYLANDYVLTPSMGCTSIANVLLGQRSFIPVLFSSRHRQADS